jgi:hypothetical protein
MIALRRTDGSVRAWAVVDAEATCGKKRAIAYFVDEFEAAGFAEQKRRELLPYAVD